MTEQVREIYRIHGGESELSNQLNFILSRLCDRLDRLEGLRGNPRFYKTLFEMPGLTAGQVLRAKSSTEAEVDTLGVTDVDGAAPDLDSGIPASIDISQSLISMRDFENDEVIHQFQADMMNANSEVQGFYTHEDPSQDGSTGDVRGPSSSVDSNVVEFSGTTGKAIKDSGISHAQLAAAVAHDTAQDAIDGLIEGDGAGNYAAATVLSGDLLVSVYDENLDIVHQYPLGQSGQSSEWFGFY